MNPYHVYLLYQAERPKTRAEVIAGDARLGEIAASAGVTPLSPQHSSDDPSACRALSAETALLEC